MERNLLDEIQSRRRRDFGSFEEDCEALDKPVSPIDEESEDNENIEEERIEDLFIQPDSHPPLDDPVQVSGFTPISGQLRPITVQPQARQSQIRPVQINGHTISGQIMPLQVGAMSCQMTSGPSRLRNVRSQARQSQYSRTFPYLVRPVPIQANFMSGQTLPLQAGGISSQMNSGWPSLGPPYWRPNDSNLGQSQFRSSQSQAQPSKLWPVPIQAQPALGQTMPLQVGTISGPCQSRAQETNWCRCRTRPRWEVQEMEESEKEYNTDYYSPTSPTPTMP